MEAAQSIDSLAELRRGAEQGDPAAQAELGRRYHDGEGVEKDFSTALQWLLKAAEQGEASAQNRLGVIYQRGGGVQRDPAPAVHWFRQAAEKGSCKPGATLASVMKKATEFRVIRLRR